MKILNDALLEEFRRASYCEWCRRPLRFRSEPNHIFTRGIGGGGRMDVRLNLIAMGCPWDCGCHTEYHAGRIAPESLFAVVAQREGGLWSAAEIETALRVVRDLPSRPIAGDLDRRLEPLSAGERELVLMVLVEVQGEANNLPV